MAGRRQWNWRKAARGSKKRDYLKSISFQILFEKNPIPTFFARVAPTMGKELKVSPSGGRRCGWSGTKDYLVALGFLDALVSS